jgi:hypothetical protein
VSQFGELLGRMDVEVQSPDHSVTIGINGTTGVRITLDREKLTRHTDSSLSRQLTAAVRVALVARGRGFNQAWRQVFGEDVVVIEPEPLTSERAHLRTPGERLRDELYAQTIRATSPHRYVEVERCGGSDEVHLRLASGAVRLSVRNLEREIQGCLAAGVQEYRRAHATIRRQVFGPGLGLSPFGEEVSL